MTDNVNLTLKFEFEEVNETLKIFAHEYSLPARSIERATVEKLVEDCIGYRLDIETHQSRQFFNGASPSFFMITVEVPLTVAMLVKLTTDNVMKIE